MPSLNWIGKEKIVNHDKDVPFRLLRKNKKYSLGESENLILEGDNLTMPGIAYPTFSTLDKRVLNGKIEWLRNG